MLREWCCYCSHHSSWHVWTGYCTGATESLPPGCANPISSAVSLALLASRVRWGSQQTLAESSRSGRPAHRLCSPFAPHHASSSAFHPAPFLHLHLPSRLSCSLFPILFFFSHRNRMLTYVFFSTGDIAPTLLCSPRSPTAVSSGDLCLAAVAHSRPVYGRKWLGADWGVWRRPKGSRSSKTKRHKKSKNKTKQDTREAKSTAADR